MSYIDHCLIHYVIFSKHIIFMKPGKFRKLHIHLPRQPIINQRPWWIAGLLLAFIILLFAAWSYYAHKKRLALPEGQRKIGLSLIEYAKGIS
jgi:hypothetical protein